MQDGPCQEKGDDRSHGADDGKLLGAGPLQSEAQQVGRDDGSKNRENEPVAVDWNWEL